MSWESKARYLEELRTKGNNDYDKVVEDMKNIERCIKAIIDNAIVWQISSDVAVKRIKNMKLNDLSLSDLIKKYLKGELVEIIPFEARVLLDSLRGRIRLYIDFDEAALIAKLKPISEKGG